MKYSNFLFAVAAFLFVFNSYSAQENVVRVATFNIRLGSGDKGTWNAWPERKGDVLRLIREMKLDVYGLQDKQPKQLEFLKKHLSEFRFIGDYRNADRVSGEASPVCFRRNRFSLQSSGTFWLSEKPDVPGLKGWGAAYPRVCSYVILSDKQTGERFCFANTHTDHKSELAREHGIRLVLERMDKIAAGASIVLVGDHNCLEIDKPSLLVTKQLKDALYASESSPKGAWRTYNGWRWREKEIEISEAMKLPRDIRNSSESKNGELSFIERCGGSRIDYIYVSPKIRVVDYKTVDSPRPGRTTYPSDHFPVVATLIIPCNL